MKNLLNFLVKYNNLIVFLILESIALSLLTSRNSYHFSRVQKAALGITRNMERRIYNTRSYLSLRAVNEQLSRENAILRNRIQRLTAKENNFFTLVSDTISGQQYQYTDAAVINNSVIRQKNFFTLDKGTRQGLDSDMAVTGPEGIAGLIVACSENYSVAISLLNIDFRISARIKSNGYFGSLNWDGRDYRSAVLNEIPQHIGISIGDTVETTGYSAIFPEGVPIGIISEFKKSGSDFYSIRVGLFTDFKRLRHVSVIGNLKSTEQHRLEREIQ